MSSNLNIHGFWQTRWLFILATAGSAIGLGNIWKFPYITGENGGGAFVLIYLLCIFIIGIPVMIAEITLGRMGRQSPINTMKMLAQKTAANPVWASVGWMGAIAGFIILSFYSVIAGWALSYTFEMASGAFVGIDSDDSTKLFTRFLNNPLQLTIWHSVFMLLTIVIVSRGVNAGLERAIRIIMPALFMLLFILFGYSLSSKGFLQGFSFMFDFNINKLTPESIIIALGHAFFTLSLGLGAVMAYGAYIPKEVSIAKTVIVIAFLDTAVAIIIGLVIFPIVFSNNLEPNAGPGLLFQTLPIAFGQMSTGIILGTLFFILISFAAWSSAIALAEPIVAWVVEKNKTRRVVAASMTGVGAWFLGLATVFSFNIWADIKLFDKTIFGLLDFATTNIMMPLGGLFIALFTGWTLSKTKMMNEVGIDNPELFALWHFTIRFLAPVAIIIVFINGVI